MTVFLRFSPLDQLHDKIPTPTPPANPLTDDRSGPVVKALKGIAALSLNVRSSLLRNFVPVLVGKVNQVVALAEKG